MKTRLQTFAVLLIAALATLFAQGPLTPPGAPAPMMKTLDQVEPRTPITTLPYTISLPGSYYVVTNLTGGSGIAIAASGVTLDLMGFELVGGTGSGIFVSGSRTNICIRNGTVRNWSTIGVHAANANDSILQELRVSNNGTHGLALGYRGRVRDCIASSNGSDGISALDDGTISGCTARQNAGDGIEVVSACWLYDNHCVSNGSGGSGSGIRATGNDNRIDSNHVHGSDYAGIEVNGTGSLIIRNSASNNNISGYLIAIGNTLGPFVTRDNIAASSNPHSNYDF